MTRRHVGECGPPHVVPTVGGVLEESNEDSRLPYPSPMRKALGPTTSSLPIWPVSSLSPIFKRNLLFMFTPTISPGICQSKLYPFPRFLKAVSFCSSFYLPLSALCLSSPPLSAIISLSARGSPDPVESQLQGFSRRFDPRGVAERESERFPSRRRRRRRGGGGER